MATLTIRKPEPIVLGIGTLYCESCKITGMTEYHEESSTSDFPYLTRKCKKSPRATFTGRIYDDEKPMHTLMNIVNKNGYVMENFVYRGLKFEKCVIVGFKIEDNGVNYITASLTVALPNMIKFA